jgi:NitT/TauT family transport system substrate-binding protein
MIKNMLGVLTLAAAMTFGAGALQAQEKIRLKMAEVVRSQFYMPMYVALGKGFAAEEGLQVDLVTTNGGDRAGAMILSGQADFALAGPEVPIYIFNGESRDKPMIFCALTATDGLFFVSRKKIDNFDWSMVNGKRIMGWRPGSTPQLYLEYVLKKKNVDPATIKSIVTNIGPAARDGAWVSGVGDFAIFNEPTVTKLERAGHASLVASIGNEVGRADYTVFFAKQSWLEKNKVAAQKWTNAIARAQAWSRNASPREIAEAIAPFFPGLTIEDNMVVVERYRTLGVQIWAETTVMDRAGLAKAQEIMTLGGVLPKGKSVPYEKIVTTEFADKAQAKLATR